jgi:hypothetical protein
MADLQPSAFADIEGVIEELEKREEAVLIFGCGGRYVTDDCLIGNPRELVTTHADLARQGMQWLATKIEGYVKKQCFRGGINDGATWWQASVKK